MNTNFTFKFLSYSLINCYTTYTCLRIIIQFDFLFLFKEALLSGAYRFYFDEGYRPSLSSDCLVQLNRIEKLQFGGNIGLDGLFMAILLMDLRRSEPKETPFRISGSKVEFLVAIYRNRLKHSKRDFHEDEFNYAVKEGIKKAKNSLTQKKKNK